MDVVQVCTYAGVLLLGFLVGVIFGIVRFGGDPPVGVLKIRYDEPEEDPYIFLELWEEAGDITKKSTVNLVVSTTESTAESYIARKQ